MSESLTFAKTPTSKWNDFEWRLTFFFFKQRVASPGPPDTGSSVRGDCTGSGCWRGHLSCPLSTRPSLCPPPTAAPSEPKQQLPGDLSAINRHPARLKMNTMESKHASGCIFWCDKSSRHKARGPGLYTKQRGFSHDEKADSNWIVKHTGTRWGSVSLVCPRWCMRACQQALCSLVSEETPRPAISL